MLNFEAWQTPISRELAELLVEQFAPSADDTRVLGTSSGTQGATRVLAPHDLQTRIVPAGRGNTATKLVSNRDGASTTAKASQYAIAGQEHLNRAKTHIERGMLSIGHIIGLVRQVNPNEVDDQQVARVLEAIKLGLGSQDNKNHPLQKLNEIALEIDRLIQLLQTTQTQAKSIMGGG